MVYSSDSSRVVRQTSLQSWEHQSLSECAVGIRWSRSFANAQATSSIAVAFVERHRGQVPLYKLNTISYD